MTQAERDNKREMLLARARLLAGEGVTMRTLAILLGLTLAAAPGARSLEIAGYVPGNIEDAVVDGSHAYCATGAGLLVLDVSDLTSPVQVAFLPLYGATVLTVADGLVYVSGYAGNGLRIVNVDDPAEPVLLATCPVVNMPTDLVVVDGYLYASVGYPGRLQVFDVRDPLHPVEAALVSMVGDALGLVGRGDLLYVAADMSGLRILDISDPSAPHEIGFCDAPGRNAGVAVDGVHAYLTMGLFTGLVVIDIADPTAPSQVGSFYCGIDGSDEVAVAGGRAYLPVAGSGLRVIDVSDPADPRETGSCAFDGANDKIVLVGTTAFVSSSYRGLHMVDIDEPAAPTVVGRSAAVGDAADVCTYGDFAYVGGGQIVDAKARDGSAGLVTVDLAPGGAPQVVGVLPTDSSPQAVRRSGKRVFSLDSGARLQAADLADPAAPRLLGACALEGAGEDLDIEGSLAFAACGGGGLRIVDIADPAAMIEVGHLALDSDASGVVVRGDLAYVTASGGLFTVDVSDPAAPALCDVAATPSSPCAVDQANGLVLVAGGADGLLVFDADDPEHPELVGASDTPGMARDVVLDWPLAVVADGSGGVRVYDLTRPSDPLEVGACPEAGHARAVTVDQRGRILAVALDKGLYVLDVPTSVGAPDDGPAAPAVAAELEAAVPNPFNPRTTVAFTLASAGPVSLRIYDAAGRRVRSLIDGEFLTAGRRTAVWDGRDAAGRAVPAGVYLCRLETTGGDLVRKMVLVR